MDLMALGQRLRQVRKQRGFPYASEVARRMGIPGQRLRRIERGETRPRPDELQRLARFYGVDARELDEWLKMAGYQQGPQQGPQPVDDKVEQAFQRMMEDLKEGLEKGLTVEGKRCLVRIYERLTGKRFLD